MSALVAAGFQLAVAVIRLLIIHLTSLFSSCRFCSEYSAVHCDHWRGRLAAVVVAMLSIIAIEVAEALPCPAKVLLPKAQTQSLKL